MYFWPVRNRQEHAAPLRFTKNVIRFQEEIPKTVAADLFPMLTITGKEEEDKCHFSQVYTNYWVLQNFCNTKLQPECKI